MSDRHLHATCSLMVGSANDGAIGSPFLARIICSPFGNIVPRRYFAIFVQLLLNLTLYVPFHYF